MPALGRTLKMGLLLFGFLSGLAQTGPASADSLRSRLPALKGRERSAALLELANSIEAKDPQDALLYATEAMALARGEGDREKEAACLSTAAFCCSQTGEFPLAIEYGRKALALGTELGNRDRMAKAHNALGITYTFLGAYSQALEEGLASLHIREELGQEKAVAQSLNLIGVIYHRSGQYEQAIDYFNQILTRVDKGSDPKGFILARLNTGFAQCKLGRFDEALQHQQAALAFSKAVNETTYDAYAYLNLGLTHSALQQYAKATHYLQLAQSEYLRQSQKHGLVQVLNAMARIRMLSGDLTRGIALAKEAADLARKINVREELQTSYELISDLYKQAGNLEESYRYYRLAVATKESIHTIQESTKFAEAAMKIVTIKKDNEIEALKKGRVISALQIEKQWYFLILLISSLCFLATIVLILGTYNKKMQQSGKSLESANADLARSNAELQDKIHQIKTLTGLLPICAQCKKIRNDEGYWTQLEGYISAHSSATFSHGICPHCAEDLYPKAMGQIRARGLAPPSQSGSV